MLLLILTSRLRPLVRAVVADPAASRASMAQTSAAFAWLHALKGRTVLIVHPFANSITVQLAKGPDALWGAYARDVMPSGIDFKVVAPPQNLAKAKESSDWRHGAHALAQRRPWRTPRCKEAPTGSSSL